MKLPKRPFFLLAAAAGAAALLVTGCTVWRLGEAKALADASVPFTQHPAAPRLRLLVVGDSTAVGTGASAPQFSVAGLLAASHPKLWVDNRARDGAKFDEVPQQLAAVQAGAYDLILISAGGNDVIRGTGGDELASSVERSFIQAKTRLANGGVVLVQPAGNVGNAPFFLPPVSAVMSSRAQALHTVVREAANRHGVRYVNLYKEKAADPFAQQPELNAKDGLHPSDAGYRVWRDELLAQSDLAQRLSPSR